MKLTLLKGYVQVIVSGVVILAAVLLVALQWGNVSSFSLYGQNRQVNTFYLMLFSAIGGVVLYFLVKVLFHGVFTLRKGFRAAPAGAEAPPK